MKSNTLYALKWIKQYFLNRVAYIFLTIVILVISFSYFILSLSGEINTPLNALNSLKETDYEYVGVTNHSNYLGDNFYQQVDSGFFYSQKSVYDEYSGKVDAIGIKRLDGKSYNKNGSPIERIDLIEGKMPCKKDEVVISENVAKRYSLQVGSKLYYCDDLSNEEYLVSGIVEEFYGAYEINIVANSGLILLHNDAFVDSSTFIQFFNKSENSTYLSIYVKNDDILNLESIIIHSIVKNVMLTLLVAVFFFVILHFKIRKYVARLKDEGCNRGQIFLFLISLVSCIAFISIFPSIILIAALEGITKVVALVMLFEFITIILAVSLILSLIFLVRKR